MASAVKMASKNKAKSADCLDQQEVLQAVVIADNFNDNFLPLTYEKPLVLFPLVNKVLLDYSLEALAKCGIQETYVFCCSHAQQIRTYISASKWSSKDATMSVTVLSSESFMSIGDVIRELDSQALIRSDFVLIFGNTVTTLNLISILEEHKKCKKNDKGCSITLIYRRALPKHRTRCLEDDVVIAVESNTNKVRFYQKVKNKKSLHIPLEVFQETSKITVHYDLLNCHMCICSPSIPPLYSDNFDYQTLDDLIRGLIINEEILGSSMYLHLAASGYAANVSNLYMYDAMSRDIIQRWSYPIVPDLFTDNGPRMWHLRHNIYKAAAVDFHRNSTIRKNVVVGKGTRIGESSHIENSVIGRNCNIGANVTIKGSYIWNNVTIGDFCTLNTCLLADEVILKEHVKISPGCVISYKVVVGDDVELPPVTKLQFELPKVNDGFGDSDHDTKASAQMSAVYDQKHVGCHGRGYLFQEPDDSDSEDDTIKDIWGQSRTENIGESEESDDDESNDGSSEANGEVENEADEEDRLQEEEDTFLFYNEVLDSLQRGIEEKIKSENLILEINSSKYAYNVTMKELNFLVTKAMLKLPFHERVDDIPHQEYFAQLKPILTYFLPLLNNYIKNASSQMDCLQSIEEFISNNNYLAPAFVKILHFYYEKDILSENVILKWVTDPPPPGVEKVRKHVMPFVTWLKEADEESSSDD